MFSFIKDKLKKIYSTVTSPFHALFSQATINDETLKKLEEILLASDTGFQTTQKIIKTLQQKYQDGQIAQGSDLQAALETELLQLIDLEQQCTNKKVFVLVGINGSGKTTFAGKLAQSFTKQGKTCILAAADTFRAAAPEQLVQWAKQSNSELFMGKQNQDPASVAFGACEAFKQKNLDYLIIDTAGRLQTKEHLMRELEKIKRIIAKQLPDYEICTLLTVDAMLGQNSFEQAQIFHEATHLDGIVLTKMDGTGKGGIVFAITEKLHIPVSYISYGESIDDMQPFDAHTYVANIVGDNQYNS